MTSMAVEEDLPATVCKRKCGDGQFREDDREGSVQVKILKSGANATGNGKGNGGWELAYAGIPRGKRRAEARRIISKANEESTRDRETSHVSGDGPVGGAGGVAIKFLGPVKQQPRDGEKGINTSDGSSTLGGDNVAAMRRETLCQWMFNLTEENMRELYEASSWGWDEKKKIRELRSPQARFVVVWRITPEAAAGKALSIASGATGGGEPTEDGHLYGGAPLAFVHYRFLEDDAKPVLYIYEIQVGEGARGMGVGQRLMKEVEAEARHKNMAKVLLTVFKRNHAAIHFYKKAGYTADETCPSMADKPTNESYVILSKAIETTFPVATSSQAI